MNTDLVTYLPAGVAAVASVHRALNRGADAALNQELKRPRAALRDHSGVGTALSPAPQAGGARWAARGHTANRQWRREPPDFITHTLKY